MVNHLRHRTKHRRLAFDLISYATSHCNVTPHLAINILSMFARHTCESIRTAYPCPWSSLKRCTDVPGAKCIEVHRPKWQGSGFPAVNGHPTLEPGHSNDPWPYNFFGTFPSSIPLALVQHPLGPEFRNTFSSESPGGTVFSSFESMAPTLHPSHWGIHAGQAWDRGCTRGPGGVMECKGDNVMAQRNYPCDSYVGMSCGLDADDDTR